MPLLDFIFIIIMSSFFLSLVQNLCLLKFKKTHFSLQATHCKFVGVAHTDTTVAIDNVQAKKLWSAMTNTGRRIHQYARPLFKTCFVVIMMLTSAVVFSVHNKVVPSVIFSEIVAAAVAETRESPSKDSSWIVDTLLLREKFYNKTTHVVLNDDELSAAVQTLGAEQIWKALLKEGAAWVARSSQVSPQSTDDDTTAAVIMEVGMHSAKQCVEAAEVTSLPVHCFEPSPQSFARVQRSVQSLVSDEIRSRIFLYNQAASATSNGTVPFKTAGGTGDHVGSHNMWTMEKEDTTNNTEKGYQIIPVQQVRLDDVVSKLGAVFLIKVDTQGFEPFVFLGLQESIRQQKIHYMLFEYWPKGMDFLADRPLGECRIAVEQVLQPLLRAGYRLYALAVAAHPRAPVGWKVEIPRRPIDKIQNHCQWYHQVEQLHPSADYKMGYWSDILAVSPQAPLDEPVTDVGRALMQDRQIREDE
jgi:FkbM family methyltransferase